MISGAGYPSGKIVLMGTGMDAHYPSGIYPLPSLAELSCSSLLRSDTHILAKPSHYNGEVMI